MQGLPRPGSRLVTQNLVISAAFAQEAPKPDWPSINDLAALIDLFCMYDTAFALGRDVNAVSASAIGELLLRSKFLRIQYPKSVASVSEAAKSHLLTYLGQSNVGELFDGLLRFALSHREAARGLSYVPDRWEEVQRGDTWLRTAPTTRDLLDQLKHEDDVARGTTFVVRSFLYLGYADVTGLVLVPDAIRTSLVGTIVSAEQEVRSKLLEAIDTSSKGSSAATHSRLSRISPLAAVVFERAHPDRSRIVAEMDHLRAELEPLRKRLHEAEQSIFYGKGNEVTDGVNNWEMVTAELRRSFGQEPHLVSLDSILRFGRNIGGLADEPMKSKAWMGVLLGLPFDVLRRMVLRRPAVELHKLRRDLPGPGRLQAAVARLFGPDIPPY